MKKPVFGRAVGALALVAPLMLMGVSGSQAYSGFELLEYCEAQTGAKLSRRCIGYIVGVSDMVFL